MSEDIGRPWSIVGLLVTVAVLLALLAVFG